MSKATVFFYGWFMDPDLLKNLGLSPSLPVTAKLPDYKFILGKRASMVSSVGDEVWGTLMTLSHMEISELYAEPSVQEYGPVNIICVDENQANVSAITYILPPDHNHNEPENSDYIKTLVTICEKLKLPENYRTKLEKLKREIEKKLK